MPCSEGVWLEASHGERQHEEVRGKGKGTQGSELTLGSEWRGYVSDREIDEGVSGG